jgi:hypothetical protein
MCRITTLAKFVRVNFPPVKKSSALCTCCINILFAKPAILSRIFCQAEGEISHIFYLFFLSTAYLLQIDIFRFFFLFSKLNNNTRYSRNDNISHIKLLIGVIF